MDIFISLITNIVGGALIVVVEELFKNNEKKLNEGKEKIKSLNRDCLKGDFYNSAILKSFKKIIKESRSRENHLLRLFKSEEFNNQLKKYITSIDIIEISRSEIRLKKICDPIHEGLWDSVRNITYFAKEFILSEDASAHALLHDGHIAIYNEISSIKKLFSYTDIIKNASQKIHLTNQSPPERYFTGRKNLIDGILSWYKNPKIKIAALIGFGGEGKSAIVRKWYEHVENKKISPKIVFWWGFYENLYFDSFVDSLLSFLSEKNDFKMLSAHEKIEKIKKDISNKETLIILDGIEKLQFKEKEQFGSFKDWEMTDLLKYILDSNYTGLCLITSRYPITDLTPWNKKSFISKKVEGLSIDEGKYLFKKIGIKGSKIRIEKVIRAQGSHAIRLLLIGKYLGNVYNGDINKCSDIKAICSYEEVGGKLSKLLSWYEIQLEESQRIFLHIASFFQRAIYREDFIGVFRYVGMKKGYNECLIDMSDFKFIALIKSLRHRCLIKIDRNNSIVIHPSIKEYFHDTTSDDIKIAIHQTIYRHLSTYAPIRPQNLNEMIPYFEMVHHGCSAKLYDDVFINVYYSKIRGPEDLENLLLHRLGGWKIGYSLIVKFFPNKDLNLLPKVSNNIDKSYLLNELATIILNISKLTDAKKLYENKIKLNIEENQLKKACIGSQNLCDLLIHAGEIKEGLKQSIVASKYSSEIKDIDEDIYSASYQAYCNLLLGNTIVSDSLINESFVRVRHIKNKTPYYINSFLELVRLRFALFTHAENIIEENYKRIVSVFRNNKWLRELGYAYLYKIILDRELSKKLKYNNNIKQVINIANKTSCVPLKIESLIEKCHQDIVNENEEYVLRQTKAGLRLVEKTGNYLYEPDLINFEGTVFLSNGDLSKAKQKFTIAFDRSKKMQQKWAQHKSLYYLGIVNQKMNNNEVAAQNYKHAYTLRGQILDPRYYDSKEKLKSISNHC